MNPATTTTETLWEGVRHELPPMLRLAAPVVMADIGWMTMGLVDTMMVGRVSAAALGAVSVGGTVFFTVALFGIGVLLGLDYTVAHAFGARQYADTHRWLVQGTWLALIVSIPGIALVWFGMPALAHFGVRPEVLHDAVLYARAASWSLLPLLVLTALRRYLQAVNVVRPIMLTVISANLLNAAANWVLIFGHLGLPAMGAEGAGWATCLARTYMAVVLLAVVLLHMRGDGVDLRALPLRPEWLRVRQLVHLGLPAAVQASLECGGFAMITVLAARLEPAALAAHHIALNAASFTFMVPLGVSSAGAVRVGQALGRGNIGHATHAGWTALALGAVFMAVGGLAFIAVPGFILAAFTTDPTVIAVGTSLLLVAAVFQLFDGTQVVATGILRGTGETRLPMIANLIGHWGIGLPLGYTLCFVRGWGVTGLWVGICSGLIAVAVALLAVWTLRVRALPQRSLRLAAVVE